MGRVKQRRTRCEIEFNSYENIMTSLKCANCWILSALRHNCKQQQNESSSVLLTHPIACQVRKSVHTRYRKILISCDQ